MKINPENNSPNLNNIIDLESAVNNIAKNKRNNGNNILIEQDIKISKDCYSCNDLPKINSFEKPDDTNKFVILSKLNNDSYNSSVKIKELNKKIKSKKLELKQNINEDSSKDKSEMNGSTARSNNNDKTTPNKSYDFKSISNFLNDVNSARSTSSINEVVSNLVIDFNKKFQKNEEKFAELESFIEKSIRSLSNQLKNFSSEMVSCNEKDISNFKEVFNHTNINSNLGAPSKTSSDLNLDNLIRKKEKSKTQITDAMTIINIKNQMKMKKISVDTLEKNNAFIENGDKKLLKKKYN